DEGRGGGGMSAVVPTGTVRQTKGIAMKAIFTLLAALLVSTIPWAAASAQYPAQYPGYAMPAGYAQPSGPVADGAASAGGASGGCASGDCGKHSLLHKLGLKSGCGAHGCSGHGCNGG